jgi:hypothetical protein
MGLSGTGLDRDMKLDGLDGRPSSFELGVQITVRSISADVDRVDDRRSGDVVVLAVVLVAKQ